VELFAASTGVAVAYGIALWAVLVIVPSTITALKGQWLLFVAGWLTLGIVWWIAAVRLARPGSWLDRRRYGPEKRQRAQQRYDNSTRG